jgi:hypothetical protein
MDSRNCFGGFVRSTKCMRKQCVLACICAAKCSVRTNRNKDELTADLLANVGLLIVGCPREKFSHAEVTEIGRARGAASLR